MNTKCLALYGSCARGDDTSQSDIDFFTIHDENEYRMLVKGRLNFAMYPMNKAIEIMQNGSLFALHIKCEGKPVLNAPLFNSLINNFKYKDSYKDEIITATILANFIVKNSKKIRNQKLMNKNLAWCIRTILIAKSAENRTPLFSKKLLSSAYHNEIISEEEVSSLIDLKSESKQIGSAIHLARKFIECHCPKISINNMTSGNHVFLERSIKRLISDTSDSTAGY